jgi:hypothetical protein
VQIHAAPDSNVRPAPPGAAGEAVPAPLRRLARSLLLPRVVGVALLAAVSSMSACIIPVAPNFQDPPTQPSSVPYLQVVSPTPIAGSIFFIQSSMAPDFTVTVSDPDPTVTLWTQWVFDYPPHRSATRLANKRMIPAATPTQVDQPVTCNFIDATAQPADGKHQLELIVATSDFENPDPTNPYDIQTTVDPNAIVQSASWTIIFTSGCAGLTNP